MTQWYETLFANYGKSYDFAKVDIFGCHLSQFSREHVLTHDDFEMLVAAEKRV